MFDILIFINEKESYVWILINFYQTTLELLPFISEHYVSQTSDRDVIHAFVCYVWYIVTMVSCYIIIFNTYVRTSISNLLLKLISFYRMFVGF